MIIYNATIHTPGREPFLGYINIEENKITEVSEGSPTKIGKNDIDAQQNIVTPGLIDAHTHLGIEEEIHPEGEDTNEMTSPLTSELFSWDGVNPFDIGFQDAAQAGITTAMVTMGSANVIGGITCVVKTSQSVEERLYQKYSGLKMAFGENPKRVYKEKHIQTRMKIMSLARQAFYDAQFYEEQRNKKQVGYSLAHEHVLLALHGKIPVRLHVHRADDILQALALKDEFQLKMVLEHVTDGVRALQAIKESGVICAIGPALVNRAKVEMENVSFKTASKLAEAGIPVAIITDHPVTPIQFLPLCVGLAMKEGLSYEDALSSVTCVPARLLGLEDKLGHIAPGYDADLVLWSGRPFTLEAYPLKVWINGRENIV